jgi:tRNA (mo5U34)-methyltransferase
LVEAGIVRIKAWRESWNDPQPPVEAQTTNQLSERDAHEAVASNPLWYHTMELRPGLVTPGWFDLRPIIDRLPWPEIEGKRCLDVGTYDGQLAFEMERRGASEVVATDIQSHLDWDWPYRHRERNELGRMAGEKGAGFQIAKEILGSDVHREWVSVYDLTPERFGTFDVIVCGSLLLHLRDPIRALEAIRGVCDGWFMSSEQINLRLSLMLPRSPVAAFDGVTDRLHWWTANRAGHRRMLESAGFRIERSSGLYANPFGSAHPVSLRSPARFVRAIFRRVVTGGTGVPSVALLAQPDPAAAA